MAGRGAYQESVRACAPAAAARRPLPRPLLHAARRRWLRPHPPRPWAWFRCAAAASPPGARGGARDRARPARGAHRSASCRGYQSRRQGAVGTMTITAAPACRTRSPQVCTAPSSPAPDARPHAAAAAAAPAAAAAADAAAPVVRAGQGQVLRVVWSRVRGAQPPWRRLVPGHCKSAPKVGLGAPRRLCKAAFR